ncbi:MAG: hypothetical protein AAFW74_16160, partial [Pseudomonadota bacterium]
YVRDVCLLAKMNCVWRLSVKPSDTPEILDMLDQQFGSENYTSQLDWGGGLVWIGVDEQQLLVASQYGDPDRNGDPDNGIEVLHTNLQYNCGLLGGHATLVKAPSEARQALPVFQPEPAPLAKISAGLRARFDPHGILNPGRMG